MNIAPRLGMASVLALVLSAGVALAADQVTLQYWVYSDFAEGDALKLQQQFIAEFEKAHPA
jgi:multiple sugar transport system substrate-binding protein